MRSAATQAALVLALLPMLWATARPATAGKVPPGEPAGEAATPAAEPIASQTLRESIHMISGEGGNIGVLTGPDGTVLIDDKFAPLTDAILDEVRALGGRNPRFVINTHFHGDHTGGNANLSARGGTIVAHGNVRRRLREGSTIEAFDMVTPAAPKAALPVISFDRRIRLHLNGQTLDLVHLPAAHTDGDSLVLIRPANVIHAGDAWFNGFYPFIDTAHGGSLDGAIAAVDGILELADDDTRIIPGHGPPGHRSELEAYRTMLITARDRLRPLKASGLTLEQVVARRPLADLEADWGGGLFPGARWIGIIWDGI